MTPKQISKEDQLKSVPLFARLGKRGLREIAQIADIAVVPAGQVLTKEGSAGYEFVMILEGQARVEKGGKVVNKLSENDFFGEIALIAKRPRVATVTSETAMKLLVVEKQYFDTLLEKTPDLWKEIAISLCSYIQDPE